MRDRPYYSVRAGKNPLAGSIDLERLLKLFAPLYEYFDDEGYFQEHLGFRCVNGFIPGSLGHDIDGEIFLSLRKDDLAPIRHCLHDYTEDDLFDVIEFLHEHCSKPTKREYHSWSDCGWHCSAFDRSAGQVEFRQKVNRILKIYSNGYELSADGEILTLPDDGLDTLLKAPIPEVDPDNVEPRIEAAQRKFRRSRSSLDERRDAVRDLADVLEYLRPKLKDVLASSDEADLFNLANNFGIRHHNEVQKLRYDRAIWYSWMFYYYLATLHAVLRLLAKGSKDSVPHDTA